MGGEGGGKSPASGTRKELFGNSILTPSADRLEHARHVGLAKAWDGARYLSPQHFRHPRMGQDSIVIVEQEGDGGRCQLLPLQELLRHIQQQVARDHAASALLYRQLDGVALLSRCEEHVWSGQPAAVTTIGVPVPGPLTRIVIDGTR